jgi:hypothetical protein
MNKIFNQILLEPNIINHFLCFIKKYILILSQKFQSEKYIFPIFEIRK